MTHAPAPMRPLRRLIDAMVRSPLGWKLLNRTLLPIAYVTMEQRRHFEHRTRWVDKFAATRQLAPAACVLHGPFAGLHYPTLESAGSPLFSKLLGSYERELHPWFEAADATGYRSVVDVGCAEGYYAVGLARRWPQATIHAYDIDARARSLCAEMAAANGVAERVKIGAHCDAATLRAIDLPAPSLIIADCEGYEAELLSEALIGELAQHDFIVELHDYYDVTISTTLKQRFAATHSVTSTFSVDDTQKVHQYRYPELEPWEMQDRRVLLAERLAVIEWIWCRSLTRAA